MFGRSRNRSSRSAGQAGVPRAAAWKSLGVDVSSIDAWEALGFDAFAAALAQGDSFTPLTAANYRRPLLKTAESWRRAGLGDISGLAWHRGGFTPEEALRWSDRSIDVTAARSMWLTGDQQGKANCRERRNGNG